MHITRLSGFGVVVQNLDREAPLYTDGLGILFEGSLFEGIYRFTEQLEGVRHFSLMPLSRLAESIFGAPDWPADRTVPQAWIEFEVDDLEAATVELESKGYELLVRARTESWGQTLTRFSTPTGLIVGLVHNPSGE